MKRYFCRKTSLVRKSFRRGIMKSVNANNFRLSIKVWSLVFASFLLLADLPVLAQHNMSNMPGMSKSKPKPKSKAKKKVARKKQPGKKHDMSNMPGMKMPGMKMSGTHGRKPGVRRKKALAQKKSANKTEMDNMPGMKMPAKPSSSPTQSPVPQPSSGKMPMNMPGMQMPKASPSASPQTQMNMPGMQMPAVSPNPQASPDQKMNMPMPMASPSPGEMSGMKGMENMPGMNSMNTGPLLVMSGNSMGVRIGASESNVINLGQMGSGTSWQPTTSPMYMMDKITGKWLLMAHFNFVAGLNSQGGPRGTTKFESANWFMPIAFHKLGKGTLQLRGMFSLEPFTFARGGSPLLFQTGETYKGQPIIDRQHPHDLFMELSAQYTVPLGEKGSWFTYFGYPGEPALGPPAFMHRASASENPSATLSHHLQDSTHISFGVFTTGFIYRWFKF